MSAPCSIGRWKTGPSSVLSQATIGVWPCFLPIASATRRIMATSTRLLVGFAGVSIRITETRPLAIASSAAALTAASFTPSAKPTAETPRLRKVRASSVSVPP
ncbi:hypothetical protein D3C71_1773370 [compost metagenome]